MILNNQILIKKSKVMYDVITKKQLKKAKKKAFKKGQIDQLTRSRPYVESEYYVTRMASLVGPNGQPVEQYLKRP